MFKTSLGLSACLVLTMALGHCSSDDKNGNATPTPTTDASDTKDTGTRTDGSANDAGPTTCQPSDLSSFAPAWKPPTAFNQGACTTQQIDTLVDCTFVTDSTACEQALKAAENAGCLGCLFTEVDAAAWGPIVMNGDFGNVNEGGCIANITGEKGATSCGAKLSALSQCESAGCDEVCTETDDQYAECLENVDSNGCASRYDDAACADPLVETGGVAEKCEEGSDFAAWAVAVGKLFCAGGASDGGLDAADGGG